MTQTTYRSTESRIVQMFDQKKTKEPLPHIDV